MRIGFQLYMPRGSVLQYEGHSKEGLYLASLCHGPSLEYVHEDCGQFVQYKLDLCGNLILSGKNQPLPLLILTVVVRPEVDLPTLTY